MTYSIYTQMLSKLKYFVAVVLAFWYFGLFYELNYYLIKSGFYFLRNKIY